MRASLKEIFRMVLLLALVLIAHSSSQPILNASPNIQLSQKDPIIWIKELDVNLEQMVIDHDDSVYLVGSFDGKLAFNIEKNEIIKTPAANKDDPSNSYIIKFDSSGRLKWGCALDSSGHVSFKDMKIDDMNSIYLTGTFEKRIVFSPIQNASELTTDQQVAVFICKFDKNGEYIWSRKWENDDYRSNEWDIAVDQDQNIYIAGAGWEGLDMDPGAGEAILPESKTEYEYDVYTSFLCKLDQDGNFVWLKSWNITDPNIPYFGDIEIDRMGHVYLTGSFEGTHDFDPNEGIQLKTCRSWIDIFLLVLDLDGNFQSVLTFGGVGMDFPDGIRIDKENSVYLFGKFSDKVDFDPGPGVAYRRAKSSGTSYSDVFILKLDSCLNYKWVNTWGGKDYSATEIFVDNCSNVYELARDDFYSSSEKKEWKGDYRLADFIRKYDKDGKYEGACSWFDDTKTGVLWMEVDSKGAFYVYGARPSYSLMKMSPLEFSKDVKTFSDLPDKTSEYKRLVESFESSLKTIHDENGSGWKIKSSNDIEIWPIDVHVSANDDIYILGEIHHDDNEFSGVDFLGKWDSNGDQRWLRAWDNRSLETSKIVTDSMGNIYVTGLFTGTIDFDPGPGVYDVTSYNKKDHFVCKFNSDADLQWVTMFAKKRRFTEPMSIAIDKDMNLYLSSWIEEDFYPNLKSDKPYDDPGNPVKANLIKIDSRGDILWFKRVIQDETEGLNDIHINIDDLTLDDRKGILISGLFSGTKDTGKSEKKEKDESNRVLNRYMVNLDFDGNRISSWIWSRSKYMLISRATYAPDGGIYITGSFVGAVDFTPGIGETLVESKGKYNKYSEAFDSFLMKLSNAGEFEWVKTWDLSQAWYVKKLRFLNDNPITNFILNPPDDRYLWIIPESDEHVMSYDMVITSDGTIYILGSFKGIIDFDSDETKVHQMLSCISRFNPQEWSEMGLSYDVATFLSKFNKDGDFQNVIRIPGTLDLFNEKGLAIDSKDNLYVILNSKGSEFGDWATRVYPPVESEELKDVFLVKIPPSAFQH